MGPWVAQWEGVGGRGGGEARWRGGVGGGGGGGGGAVTERGGGGGQGINHVEHVTRRYYNNVGLCAGLLIAPVSIIK